MKVLHINQSDVVGGAGIAAFTLHRALARHGVHSSQLVGQKLSDDLNVAPLPRRRRLEKLARTVTQPSGLNYAEYVGSLELRRYPQLDAETIIHLHNMHSGAFSYLALFFLKRRHPMVLTLHDMYPFTGHCAYSYACQRWRTGCGHCPLPSTYPAVARDATRLEWALKRRAFARSRLTVVSPSRWLANLAQSSLLRDFPIRHVPNGIDLEAYRVVDRGLARNELGLPTDRDVLLFGAQNLRDERKGGDLLVAALNRLPDAAKRRILLVTLGHRSLDVAAKTGISTVELGYVNDDQTKRLAYAAADLFLHPARADNYPLVIQESLACGTPVVAFAVGGVPELVLPGTTGYLVEPFDVEGYAMRVLEGLQRGRDLRATCRAFAESTFALDAQTSAYVRIYAEAHRSAIDPWGTTA